MKPLIYLTLVCIGVLVGLPFAANSQTPTQKPRLDHSRIVRSYGQGGFCGGVGLDLHDDKTFSLVDNTSPAVTHASGHYYYSQTEVRFVIEKVECTDLTVDTASSSGIFVLSPQESLLIPDPAQQVRAMLLPGLLIVPWDQRIYLIAPDHMLEFCNAVNSGWEKDQPSSFFFSSAKHRNTAAHGFPFVSACWKQYILPSPVQGRVEEIVDMGTSAQNPDNAVRGEIIHVMVDKGERQRLKIGMTLFIATNPPNQTNFESHFLKAVICQVAERTSVAKLFLNEVIAHMAVGNLTTTGLSEAESK